MQLPVNITYRGLKKSQEIEQLVLEKATRLDKFCDHISRCDVAIEQPNHTHKKGNQFRVRIDVTVPPGHELVAEEKQIDNGTHEPLGEGNTRRIQGNGAGVAPGRGQTTAQRENARRFALAQVGCELCDWERRLPSRRRL